MAGEGDMKLLGLLVNPFVTHVRMAVNMKGVSYEYIEQDVFNKSEPLLKSNPVHKKVLLIHNGKPIPKSLVIVQYVDEVMANPRPGGRSMHRPGTANQGVEVARPRPRRSSNFSGEITDGWPRGVVKVGPWGGSGGQPFYMRGSSVRRLRSITLYHSSSAIHSLCCAYYSKDEDGHHGVKRKAGPWGLPHSFGSTALRATIYLSADEHLTAIEGTSGHFGRLPDPVITSLSFRTNTGKTYGPYGEKRGTRTTFSVPAENGCIVGFWGRSGWLLDAIGVYMRA